MCLPSSEKKRPSLYTCLRRVCSWENGLYPVWSHQLFSHLRGFVYCLEATDHVCHSPRYFEIEWGEENTFTSGNIGDRRQTMIGLYGMCVTVSLFFGQVLMLSSENVTTRSPIAAASCPINMYTTKADVSLCPSSFRGQLKQTVG